MNETIIILPSGVRERIPAPRLSLKERARKWLWEAGIIDLPVWEQPEVPVVRGGPLRAALERSGRTVPPAPDGDAGAREE